MVLKYPHFFLAAIMLCGLAGCAKKTAPRYTLKPAVCYNYTNTIDDITVQVAYVSPKQFKRMYPSQLHQHRLLAEHETYFHKKEPMREKRVRLLQGTITNNTDQKIYIGRKNVSLPVMKSHEVHKKRTWLSNFCFGWLGCWGALGLFICYLGIAIPSGFIVGSIFLGLALPGAVGGTLEHLKEKDRKHFVEDTMLHSAKHTIHPGETFSWFMLIPYEEYKPNFTITCTDKCDKHYQFDVNMRQKKSLPLQ